MSAVSLLVPGGRGQLGSEIARLACAVGAEVVAPGSAELDIAIVGDVVVAVRELAAVAREAGRRPIVINTAAYTAVDAAETDELGAFKVNADGPRVLAAACSAERVPLLHVSTDYVFSGETSLPYEPDAPLSPRSAYGRTKAAGERAVLGSGADAWVVRTAWVYGPNGRNFVRTMLRLEQERDTLSVVADQHGSPTLTTDLALGLLELAARVVAGDGPDQTTLHCAGGGDTTWYGLAKAVFQELGAAPERVRPCTTADFPRPAPRPANSVLSPDSWTAAGLTPLRDWRSALSDFVAAERAGA